LFKRSIAGSRFSMFFASNSTFNAASASSIGCFLSAGILSPITFCFYEKS
jgi:hypothetical protein